MFGEIGGHEEAPCVLPISCILGGKGHGKSSCESLFPVLGGVSGQDYCVVPGHAEISLYRASAHTGKLNNDSFQPTKPIDTFIT